MATGQQASAACFNVKDHRCTKAPLTRGAVPFQIRQIPLLCRILFAAQLAYLADSPGLSILLPGLANGPEVRDAVSCPCDALELVTTWADSLKQACFPVEQLSQVITSHGFVYF